MKNKLYRYLFFLLFLVLLFSSIQAQTPSLYWEQFYGGTKVDFRGKIKHTADKGFVIAGHGTSVDGDYNSTNNGANDFQLIKTDSCGKKLWGRVAGGNSQDILYALSETTEHGFLLSGITFSTNLTNGYHGGVEDALVCKVDANGNIQWIKTFGGSGSDILLNAVALPDSSFIIAGFTSSTDGDGSAAGKNGWILKLDKNGNITWKNFPGNGGFYFTDIKSTDDGNFILCDQYGSIVKIDGAGNLLWEKNYGCNLLSIQKSAAGGYIACGGKINNNGGQDGFVLRIDDTGNTIWQKLIGGTAYDLVVEAAVMPDNTFVFAGFSNSSDGDVPTNHGMTDGFAFSLDQQGTILWTKSYGGSGRDELNGVTTTADGSILLSGFTGSSNGEVSGNHPSWDFVMLKLKDKKTTVVDSVSCIPFYLNNIFITHDTSFIIALKDKCNFDSGYTQYNIHIKPETVHSINDVTVNFLEPVTLTTVSSGPVTWNGTGLSCYNCVSPVVHPMSDINNYIVQTGSGNCMVSDTVTIYVKATDTLYIPSAFTPNGDGKNDLFNALGIVTDYSMEIFNRWGQKIFKTTSLLQGWNGTYKGVNQPADVFAYVIQYRSGNNIVKKIKGTFTLIR